MVNDWLKTGFLGEHRKNACLPLFNFGRISAQWPFITARAGAGSTAQ